MMKHFNLPRRGVPCVGRGARMVYSHGPGPQILTGVGTRITNRKRVIGCGIQCVEYPGADHNTPGHNRHLKKDIFLTILMVRNWHTPSRWNSSFPVPSFTGSQGTSISRPCYRDQICTVPKQASILLMTILVNCCVLRKRCFSPMPRTSVQLT